MSSGRVRRMCVCCGEWYYIAGEMRHVEDRMCSVCVRDLQDMDGPEYYGFVKDVLQAALDDEHKSKSFDETPTVEQLIAVMDH